MTPTTSNTDRMQPGDSPAIADPPAAPAPVVCIGLSAGGLHPLRAIFRRIRTDTGMAFVIIPHISRNVPTHLPGLISRWTRMPAKLAQPGLALLPNHIYVIPPGQEIRIEDGTLAIQPRSKTWGWSNVITLFLDSLVQFRKPPGIAVILSGFDSDGAAALRDFHRQGGLTIVQDLKSADFRDMPRSAIATGVVDYVLPAEEIVDKIESLADSCKAAPRE
jgi:two-component system, chemotaxis family, protein-glutamate methylesterase/glutaminase